MDKRGRDTCSCERKGRCCVMTQRQIDAALKTLPHRCDIPYHQWKKEQKTLCEELNCREMINSCLCYDGIEEFWKEHEWRTGKHKSYAGPYIEALGIDRVRELVAEQEADFAKARVERDVYEDSEGLTYNSIIWADEM